MKSKAIRPVILALAAAAVAACSSGYETGSTASLAGSTRAPLSTFKAPSWASSSSLVGRVTPSSPITLHVHLAMHDPEGAKSLLADVTDPTSSSYRQFLTTEEWNARFAPNDEDVAAVRAHLEANGLTVVHVPSNRAYISVQGPTSAVEAAFGTRLGRFSHPEGEKRAPLDKPTLPASIAARVGSVFGLTTTLNVKPAVRVKGRLTSAAAAADGGVGQDAGPPAAPSCSNYFGEYKDTSGAPEYGPGYKRALPLELCTGYIPSQIRHAYGLDEAESLGADGAGETVAIVDAWMSTTLLADAQAFALAHDPSHPLRASQFTATWTPGTAVAPYDDWSVEEALDIETVHGVAPGAHIAFVAAQSESDADLLAAINYVVSDNLASIVSNSWGFPEADYTNVPAFEAVAVQAGLKGIGLYFASHDYGDWVAAGASATPAVTFPASLPQVTAVGGTSLALGRDNNREFEVGWESSYSFLEMEYGVTSGDGGAATRSISVGASMPTAARSADAGSSIDAAPSADAGSSIDAGSPIDAAPSPDAAGLLDASGFDATGPNSDGGSLADASGDDGGGYYSDDGGDDGGADDAGDDAGNGLGFDAGFDAGPGTLVWSPADPGQYYSGAGGGVSSLFAQPSYQRGAVPSSLSGRKSPMRTVPDVAMLADPETGELIGLTSDGVYSEFSVGGTSLATPMFAATMAVAQQLHGRRFGASNAALYQAARTGAFTDIVPARSPLAAVYPPALYGAEVLITFDYHGPENTNATAIGYDTVTGLGAPSGLSFFRSLR